MLTSFFLVSKPFYIRWEEKFLSVHAKFEKNSQCWQAFYLSGNEIWIFFRKIFIFRYHWQVKYLSAIESFDHAPRFFLVFDMCFTCQCMLFLKPDKCFTCQLIILWLVEKKTSCQCSFSLHWEEKSLSVQFFDTLRRKKLVS